MKKYLIAFGVAALLPTTVAFAQNRPTLEVGCATYGEPIPRTCARTGSFVRVPDVTNEQAHSSYASASTSAFNVVEGKLYSTDAFARASLLTGQLGVSVAANDLAATYASAQISDRVTFNVPNSSFVDYEVTIHGKAFTGQAGRVNLQYGISFISTFFGSSYVDVYELTSVDGEATEQLWSSFYGYGERESEDVFRLTGSLYLLAGSRSFDFFTTMSAGVTGPGYAQFGNTASVKFVLPEGATFTSESGLLLSEVAAVPEPATWAMMMVGFGMIGGTMRARRRQRVHVTYA